MKEYLELLNDVLTNGEIRQDRTGVGTKSLFGKQLRFDLSKGFPATTTKKLAWNACVSELLWFLEGSGDERRLAEILHGTRDSSKTTIWTANANADYWKAKAKFDGDLGKIYGVMWRSWPCVDGSVDQISELIKNLKNDPHGRRHILTAWNPGELKNMALPPCHMFAQFYVSNDNRLSCQMYQRSQDLFLGGPFNYASYSLLTHMIAQVCDFQVGEFINIIGDAHIYLNHIDQTKEQMSRIPFPLPKLWLNPEIKDINKFTMNDIKLLDYQFYPSIFAPMAV